MKKYSQKMTAIILFCSILLALLVGIIPLNQFSIKAFALEEENFDYTTIYTNVEDAYLDKATYDPMEKDVSAEAQITVFTHGLGGLAFHWSNDGENNFAYDSRSMPEQLRMKLEEESAEQDVALMVVKPNYDLLNNVGSIPEGLPIQSVNTKTKENAQSRDIEETEEDVNGSSMLRGVYRDYTPTSNSRGICLYECNGESYPNIYSNDFKGSLSSSDVNKHIILIFEQWSYPVVNEQEKIVRYYTDESNDFVYSQFEYCLDAISYQYRQLTGVLPRYNLVAHSRGGLTNMQYALGHPNSVVSMYSVGSPYNGSALGNINFILETGRQKNTYQYLNGMDFSPGVLDITNSTLTESYKSYWNEHYDEYYSHISFNPLGSYVTAGFILQTASEVISEEVLDGRGEEVLRAIAVAIEIISEIENYIDYADEYVGLVYKMCLDTVEDLLPNLHLDDVWDLWEIINNINIGGAPYEHLGTAIRGRYVYADDLFIDLNSQVADGYLGREVRVKLMDSIDQINGMDRKTTKDIGVAHNLEARDPDIVEYIVEHLTGGSSRPYDYRYADGGYHITNMNYAGCVEGVLTIPSNINGVPVIGIDRLTRNVTVNDNKTYHPEVTKVILPASVEYISNYAFYGMRNLETVEFEAGSVLEKVDVGAFMDCTSLKNITLPSSTWIIGMKAFANCTSLQNFQIPMRTATIGSMAFAGCKELTAFTVENGNYTFAEEDGVLMDVNKTQLLYYPAKKGTSYVVPNSVTEIGPFAFAGGNTLTSIDLNNVTMLRMGAFGKCTSLTNITANNLEIIEGGVVDDTAWKAAQTGDKILLGDVLLSYQGTETDVVLENINSIAPYAFAGNENLESVTLTRGIISIGEHAFDQCENLENVYICNNADVVQVLDAAFDGNAENRKIYVPYPFVNQYETQFSWYDFNVHETVVSYDSKGGSACEGDKVYYQDYLELPMPTREGYTFIGWYLDEKYTGDPLNSQARWNSVSDTVTLYAKWSANSYDIMYDPDDSELSRADMGSSSGAVEYGSSNNQFIVPTRRGYIFNGWYTERNGAGTQVSNEEGNALIVWEYANDKTLYASWTVIEYTITYNLDGGSYENGVSNPEAYTIETETFALNNPVKETYNFKGWIDELTGEMSEGVIYQGSIGDREYTAQYAQTYCIMFDSNFGSFCPAMWAEKNQSISLPYSIRDGYTGKWDGLYEFGSMYTVTGEKWFVAEWTGNTYTITFDNNGGIGGPTQETVQFEEAFPVITLPTKEGYCFDYYVTDDGGQYYMNGGTEDSLYYYNRDIRLTAHWTESFLAIENLGKSGTKWNIKITNNSSKEVTVEYNTKMCNASDAKNWTGLKNVETFKLEPNGASATVTISENWFATSITVSYKTSDGIRRITYANNLDANKTMNIMTNKIT